MKRTLFSAFIILAVLMMAVSSVAAAPADKKIGINVVFNGEITEDLLTDLGTHGNIRDVVYEIDAVTMQVLTSELSTIRSLPYVASASPDAVRNGAPVDAVAAANFTNGISTWDQDAINVTSYQAGRTISYTGEGVYVAVLDTGLLDSWRTYFPQERVATEFAKAFNGGGGENGNVSEPTNKWEHDQNSHGTHVVSSILGYSLRGTPINGAAPMVKIIPVKVLNQNGSGWSSVVARGIIYVAELKKSGALGDSPVVINMSLGGPELDAMEKDAIDYAIDNGVIIVASAGNEGTVGMGYPGAYEPVISVAASGWVGEWTSGAWWNASDVPDPTNPEDYYITDFSSRALAGQDLDVAAPGSWVVGPYQKNSGTLKQTYFYLGGTSMASPHVAGIVALMVQKDPSLTASEAEGILESSAVALPAGCRDIIAGPNAGSITICWEADATGAGLATADAALAAIP